MDITVTDLSKRYINDWIFKHLTYKFTQNNIYAITGSNGSGKSTLLQVLCGFQPATSGNVTFSLNGNNLDQENIYKQIAYASPSLDLIEEFSLVETIKLHKNLGFLPINTNDFLDAVQLEKHKNKALKFFSSGMRQRVKLGLCFYSNKPILFLDEPTVNFDLKAKNWYAEQLEACKRNKLIIIASNDPLEYEMATQEISIEDYKK
jgi:ABC-type multidrug transport system ATPase subunit